MSVSPARSEILIASRAPQFFQLRQERHGKPWVDAAPMTDLEELKRMVCSIDISLLVELVTFRACCVQAFVKTRCIIWVISFPKGG